MRWFWHSVLAGSLILGTTAGCGRVLQGAISAAPAFLPISDQQEIAIGRQAALEVIQQMPPVQNPALQAYVQNLGEMVAAQSGRTDIPYNFVVVQSEDPNAFALPGGFIFITTGMLRTMENEAQLAGVLAHEVAHVAQRHAISLIRQEAVARGIQIAALGTDAGITQAIGNVIRTLVTRGYGRQKELEADRLGTIYAAQEDYRPTALSDYLVRLNQITGGQPPWLYPLSTHPPVDQRVQAVRETIETYDLEGDEVHRERFLQNVAPILR